MDSLPLQPSWALVAGLTVLVLIALLGWSRERSRLARSNRRRHRTARRAESEAELLLERHGYEILERQARTSWQLGVDDEAQEVWSQVDLLVERNGRLYLADVKSGSEAPLPSRPATRRQLLEYHLAFGVDGALVVDMAVERIRRVDFGDLLRRA